MGALVLLAGNLLPLLPLLLTLSARVNALSRTRLQVASPKCTARLPRSTVVLARMEGSSSTCARMCVYIYVCACMRILVHTHGVHSTSLWHAAPAPTPAAATACYQWPPPAPTRHLHRQGPLACSFDRCLSTLLHSVFCAMRGPSVSMLFSVSSRMYALLSTKPVCGGGSRSGAGLGPWVRAVRAALWHTPQHELLHAEQPTEPSAVAAAAAAASHGRQRD